MNRARHSSTSAHSRQINSAVSIRRANRAPCPAHSGINALLPCLFDSARIDSVIWSCKGYDATSLSNGDIISVNELQALRASFPVNDFVRMVLTFGSSRMARTHTSSALDSVAVRNAVPICTALAPSASTATIPHPSMMPPAAITGIDTASRTSGSNAINPTSGGVS